MSIVLESLRLTHLFETFFSVHKKMHIGKMYFRLYDPRTEHVVSNYNTEDWNLIFQNTTEDDLKELSFCKNVTILIWCDKLNDTPLGMVLFEENIHIPNQVSFHGGTWEHSPQYYLEIFRSLTNLFDVILDENIEITTTCSIENQRAAKFQESLGFVEVNRDDHCIYKKLIRESYQASTVVNKMRIQDYHYKL